jgi:two-component system nitrate/nitrite response regulator NarL
MIRIAILDEQRLFTDSFRRGLEQDAPSIEVVGAVATAREAFELVRSQPVDLLVCDLLLHGTDATAVARELARCESPTGVLVLTTETNRAFVVEAIQAGARGYALKTQPLEEVIDGIIQAGTGGRYFAPSLQVKAEAIPRTAASATDDPALLGRLSRREREVFLQIIRSGSSTREIARALSISVKTVETHRSHINRKVGVHSPAELIRVAASAGLLGLRPEAEPVPDRLPARSVGH